jgi:hypothetical protein
MSFNRPDYLMQVLQSLKGQTISVDESRLYLFQDGAKSRFREERADDSLQDECVKCFLETFPIGKVLQSPINLGIALNFDRAERLFFEELKVECGLFFEDDLVLSPYYLETLLQLADFAMNEPLVAYAAAYGDHTASLSTQRVRSAQIVPMLHKWGFALTRRQWLRQQTIVDGYLAIVREKEYGQRDHAQIESYFESYGFRLNATSQDGAKDLASLVLGTTKLMCLPCFGKYIGREGMHSGAKLYEDAGYGKTELFDGFPPRFDFPSGDQLQKWVSDQQAHWRCLSAKSPAAAKIEDLILETSAIEFVKSIYLLLLNRQADAGGLKTWVEYLRSGKSLAEVVGRITDSSEYQTKMKSRLLSQVRPNEARLENHQ